MSFALQPWQLLVTILAGWVNRRQQAVIEYLRTENQVLIGHVSRARVTQKPAAFGRYPPHCVS
jgi:hypothetical protein